MKRLVLAALMAAAAVGPAFAAQPTPMTSNSMTTSGGAAGSTNATGAAAAPSSAAPSPAMVKVMTTCKADFAKVCPGKGPGPEMRQCVQENFGSLSQPCQGVIMEMVQSGGG